MNYLLKYKLIAFCMLWCPVLMAQTQATFSINETIQTPQTQSFVRYGNNPVNLYTGTTGVSIPVYTYKDNDFEIPISLEYASSGLVANHQTGILGQGWYLNTGGVITRTVVGIPDENFTNAMAGYYDYHRSVPVDEKQTNPLLRGKSFHDMTIIDEPFAYLYNPSVPSSSMYESTPDIFQFNFMGYQGSFQFDVNKKICIYNTNTARDNFRIKVSNFQNRPISSFEITTNDGYKYIFGGDQSGLYDRECNIVENTAEQTVISWQLTKIIAPNGRKVSLKYRSGDYMNRGIVKNIMPSSDYKIVSTQSGGSATYYESSTVSQFPTYLESILVEDVCRIQLDYTAKEPEKYGTDRDLRDLPSLLKLSSVTVNSLSPSLEQILHCDLGYKYTGQNKTLFLKEVNFGEGKIYKMKYIGVDDSPSLAAFPLNNTCAVDHWGYYNGKLLTSINNFIPSTTTDKKDKEVITSEQREADPMYSQLGMLKRISYPTGGYTMYEYEGNTYSRRAMDQINIRSVAVDKQAGGVRIKTISDYTETGECNRREFTYQNSDGTSSGILLKMPRYRLDYTIIISNRLYYINRGNAQDMSTYSLEGPHIEYARIVEKKSDGSMTEYKYKNSFDLFIGDNTQVDAQDLTFIPNQRINSSNSGMARFLLSRLHSNAYKRGLLKSLCTTINGETIYSEEYSYLNPEGKKYPTPGYQTALILNVKTAGDVFYIDQINAVNKAQIGRKTTKEYINGNVFTTQKEYKFESSCGRLNCVATTLSNGDILRERIEYPEDMKTPTDIEKMMVDSFLTSMPVRKALTIQKKPNIWLETLETVISGEYNKYKKYGKLIKLEEVRKTAYDQLPQWKDFNLDFVDSDFRNDTYDSWGNLTQQTAKDGSVTSYTWGYNNRYPVTIEKSGLKTRYEYKPLIGMTSVTDIRGIKTYYEYDKAGRLQCVKDNDKNVIARYDYHYSSENNN